MKKLYRFSYLSKVISVFFGNACIFLLFVFTSNPSFAQDVQQNDRVNGWSSDIDTLLSRMKEQHYVYKTKPLPDQLIKNAALLKTKVAQYSDERMMGELERLMWYMTAILTLCR